MKKAIIPLIFFLLILSYGCKKSKNEAPGGSTGTSSFGSTGVLIKLITQNINADTLGGIYDDGGSAWFLGNSGNGFIHVDSVLLNGIVLQTDSSNFYTTYNVTGLPNSHWHVKGNNGIPSFDYTNTKSMPSSFGGYHSLPDSVKRTQNITIPISGISNATGSYIFIQDNYGHSVYKDIPLSATSVTFTSAELLVLNVTTTGFF